jgi:hypothetical protein
VVHHQIMASERMGGYVHNTYTQKLVKRDHWTKLCKHSKIVHVALGIRPRIIPCSGEDGSPESSSLLQQSPGDMSESRHSDDGTQNSAIDCGMEDDMVPNRLPHDGPDQLRPGLAAALHSDISQVLDEMLPGNSMGNRTRVEPRQDIVALHQRRPESDSRERMRQLSSLTWSDMNIYRFIMDAGLTTADAGRLLKVITDVRFHPLHVSYSSLASYNRAMSLESAGLRLLDLTKPRFDGQDKVMFWYRSVWEMITDWLKTPEILNRMSLSYAPRYSRDGLRLFVDFASSHWLQSVYAKFDDPAVTVIGIIIGSDAYLKHKRRGHPIYMTVANLPEDMIQSENHWKVIGCFPQTKHIPMSKFAHKRRESQVHDSSRCALLEEAIAVCRAGGQHVLCADGLWRKVVPVLMLYVGDRLEHQDILLSHPHSCLLCKARIDEYGVRTPSQVGGYLRGEIMQLRHKAMHTGEYGENMEWKQHAQAPRAIAEFNQGTGEVEVVSEVRYKHCAQVIKVLPDTCRLMDMCDGAGIDLAMCCMPDPMHTVPGGVMHHLLRATIATLVQTLSPTWAVAHNLELKMPSLGTLCDRLDARVKTALPRGPKRVREAFRVAYQNLKTGRKPVFTFETTASETEVLFGVIPFCLSNLIEEEINDLNQLAEEHDEDTLLDPTDGIVEVLAMFQVCSCMKV